MDYTPLSNLPFQEIVAQAHGLIILDATGFAGVVASVITGIAGIVAATVWARRLDPKS